MKAKLILTRHYFYPLLFCLWGAFLLIRYGGHRYFDTPFPSAGTGQVQGGADNASSVRRTIAELRQNLFKEKKRAGRARILENMGYAYFELYRGNGDRGMRDSAYFFVRQAVAEDPANAQLHCNLGGLFSETGDAPHALEQYELALRIDSTHILALLNAGMCSYSAAGRRTAAARYFTRALAVDGRLPMCHGFLGLIALDEKDSIAARESFEKEAAADNLALVNGHAPLTPQNVRFAAAIAHRNLMALYSTKFRDQAKAYRHFGDYRGIEADQSKKEAASLEMKKWWGKPR